MQLRLITFTGEYPPRVLREEILEVPDEPKSEIDELRERVEVLENTIRVNPS